jgi:hypothetical protein
MEKVMPLLFWMPLIIMRGLFGVALEPARRPNDEMFDER